MNLINVANRHVVPRGSENQAVWDGVRQGHYEVWFLTFNSPAERVGFWLRYTFDAPSHGEPIGELWGHFFDGKDPDKRFGLRKRVPRAGFSVGGDSIIRIGEARLTEDAAIGSLEGNGHSISWDLTHDRSSTAVFLGPAWLRPILERKRTDYRAPNIDIRYRGRVVVDGRTFELESAPGEQVHLVGLKHQNSWTWLHCNCFDHGRSAVVEIATSSLP